MADKFLYSGQVDGSGAKNALFVDAWTGTVNEYLEKETHLWSSIETTQLTGTDALTTHYMGELDPFVKYQDGQAPESTDVGLNSATIRVDTLLTHRISMAPLAIVQDPFKMATKLGRKQGRKAAQLLDELTATIALKAAKSPALASAYKAGTTVTLGSGGDEANADKLYKAIVTTIVGMENKDVPTDDLKIFVNPTQYEVLTNHPKLINKDFSNGNGDFSDGKVMKVYGVPVVKTRQLPQTVVTSHPMSNSGNGNIYNVSSSEAKVVALIFSPEAMFGAVAIAPTPKEHLDDVTKMRHFDLDLAVALGVNIATYAGAVFKA